MLIRHSIKTAIAASFLAALFQHSDLAHIQYPVMGLIATMVSSVGDTVKAGWGRLGGSAIAGLATTLVFTTLGANPTTGAITFILASLVCEAFQWKALTSQAGVISALIAAEPELNREPGSYAWSRVFDNAIGVIIGTAVTALFWPENPRQKLQNNLVTILDYTSQCFEIIISSAVSKNYLAEIDGILAKITDLAQQSENILKTPCTAF